MRIRFLTLADGVSVREDAILEFYVSDETKKPSVCVITYDTEHVFFFETEEDALQYHDDLSDALIGVDQDEEA